VLTRTFKTLLNFRLSTKYRTSRKSDPSNGLIHFEAGRIFNGLEKDSTP
jgi:hypothetical protein